MKKKDSLQKTATEKLSIALATFATLEQKLKFSTELTKKEKRLHSIVCLYGNGLDFRDTLLQYNSCIQLYRFFNISFKKSPETAKLIKYQARDTYKNLIKKPLQLSLIG